MPNQAPARRFRFGVFEADAATGELRKSGVRLRVPDQAFQVLLMLLQRGGEVVTREELRQKLWPEGTFVDFEHSLNSIVNKLREVLGDSATNPRFIETLARRGYRFLVPVEVSDPIPSAATAAPAPVALAPQAAPETAASSLLTSSHELPRVPHGYVRLLFLLIQLMYLSFYVAALANLSAAQEVLEDVLRLPGWVQTAVIVSAAMGIPVRLYLLSFVAFNVENLAVKFHRLFIAILLLDGSWALAPFLLVRRMGWGLALGATAALIYVPFAQRTLVLMRERAERD
jgi:cholera toxin transcriptional activator